MKEFNRLNNPVRRLCSGTNATGNQQDCLGMTPLHILACPVKPSVELCRLLIEKYPESLVVKDKWGEVPLLYALWSNACPEMVQLLVDNKQWSAIDELIFGRLGLGTTSPSISVLPLQSCVHAQMFQVNVDETPAFASRTHHHIVFQISSGKQPLRSPPCLLVWQLFMSKVQMKEFIGKIAGWDESTINALGAFSRPQANQEEVSNVLLIILY